MAQNLIMEMLQAIDDKYCYDPDLCHSMTNEILSAIEDRNSVEEIVDAIAVYMDGALTDEQQDVIETVAEQLLCLQEPPVSNILL